MRSEGVRSKESEVCVCVCVCVWSEGVRCECVKSEE